MPRVSAAEYPYTPFPTVETPSGTDALNSAYQRIQTTPGMFGGLTAEALQQLSGQLEKSGTSLQGAAIETQNLHNQVVVDQQISSYEDKVNKILYGDPSVPGDTGYMGLRGQAALDARAGLNARLEQLTNDHAAVLQNTQQRLHFANQSRRYRNYMQTEIGKHYEAEYTRNAAQTMEGRANTSLGNAGIAANNNDFEAWKSAWGTGRAALQDSMNLPGRQLPPELQESKLREYDEKAIGDWAQKLAIRDPLKADQFLDANRDYLPTQYDNLKRSVKAEHDKALSNAIATGAPLPSSVPNVVPRPGAYRSSGDEGQRIAATLRARGWSDAAIEGALNNAITESSLNPNATGAGGEKGLYQFHPSSHLPIFRRDYKGDNSIEAQTNYMADVVEREIPGYKRAGDGTQATRDFMLGFERPRDQSDAAIQARAANSTASRSILTKRAADQPPEPGTIMVGEGDNKRPMHYERDEGGWKIVDGPAPQTTTPTPPPGGRSGGGGIPASILDEGAGGGDAPDTLVRNLPEPEAGTLPDSELGAAYQQRIEAAAKRVPPGTSIEVWHNAVRQIRREMSWQISMQRRDQQAAEQRAKAAMHDAENQIYRDVYSTYPKITPQQIATDPRFDIDPTRRRQMLELVNNPPGTSVPPAQSWAAAQSLIERIRLPEGTSGKITDTGQIYDNMRLLNKSDFEFVMKQFNDIRAPGGQTLSRLRDDFVKRYSGFITKSNPMAGLVDAVGEARLYEFERYIDQKVDEYKKAGKDPTVLFTDTGSPTFLGHESVIRQFQPTPEQSRQAVSGSVQGEMVPLPPLNRPAPPPPPPIEPRRLPGGGMEVPIPPPPDAMRRPDESPDQYLQRRQAQ